MPLVSSMALLSAGAVYVKVGLVIVAGTTNEFSVVNAAGAGACCWVAGSGSMP